MSSNDHNSLDFGRSYLYFQTNRVNHTPRLAIDAACTLTYRGESRRFYLTCACIAEAMYLESGLIHEPVAEFNLIASPRDQFLMLKRHAFASDDQRAAHRFTDTMPTHDGRGTTFVELGVSLAEYPRTQRIESYAQFHETLLNFHPVNARTTFTEEDGTEVLLEYPARTVNVAHAQEAWQVDAGPILIPIGPRAPVCECALPVEALDLGYLVYNRENYAEAVVRYPSASAEGAKANFYSLRRKLQCQNELFVAK